MNPLFRNISLGIILAASVVSCAKRDSSSRDKLVSTAAVGAASAQAQGQTQIAQNQAAQANIKTNWDSAQPPVADAAGNINVTTTFAYNSKLFQVTSTHQVTGSNVSLFQQQFNLNIDGMSVVASAGCSDSQCSQYVVTYNFYKNSAEIIQQLVWIDYSGQSSPRIMSLPAGQFYDIYTWYKFASDSNNFLAH